MSRTYVPKRSGRNEAELQLEELGPPNQLAAVTADFSDEPAQFAELA